ncbi:hypothetical protein A8M77_33875 [Variovorax sp. JS1663]|nr:hypothetical protein A8M77_33875 [Variovorax sp. JS1663]
MVQGEAGSPLLHCCRIRCFDRCIGQLPLAPRAFLVQDDLRVLVGDHLAVAHLAVAPVEEAHGLPQVHVVRTARIRRGSASMRSMMALNLNSSRLLARLENQIRPIALGRSNWLFAGSLRAGQRAAAVMSLVHSARLNGHEPHAYLRDILERLPTQPASRIEELLPHRWQPPTPTA